MSELVKKQKTNVVELKQESNLSPLVQAAMTGDIDVEKLNALLDIQQRHESMEAEKRYTVAMASFKTECPSIVKTKKGHNSNYAGLAETIEQIKGLLSEFGLSHSWKTNQDNGSITVTCCIKHIAGHQECTTLSASADTSGSKSPIQAVGSTITYLERYTLFAILGLASSEQDTDGRDPELEAIYADVINDEQLADLRSLIQEKGRTEAKLVDYLKQSMKIKINALEQLPSAYYDKAVSIVESAK